MAQNGHTNQTTAFEVCRERIEDCARKLGAGFIDTYGKSGIYGYNESVSPYYLGDGTHPTAVVGMTRLAEFFSKQIVTEV